LSRKNPTEPDTTTRALLRICTADTSTASAPLTKGFFVVYAERGATSTLDAPMVIASAVGLAVVP
jgi:hypothetical protein